MQNTIKLGFTKSKAYGLCGVILMAALFTTAIASADEVTPASNEPTTEIVTTNNSATTNTDASATTEATAETPASTEATAKPSTATETIASDTPTNTEAQPATTAPTEITKEGDTITVKNPEVDMHFTKGANGDRTGRYVNFKVEYKNIHFANDMAINAGDKLVFHMPKEVSFSTNFDFDVMDPSNKIIGHANADTKTGTVTTVFNDVFQKNPLNKQMGMIFDANWTDAIEPGKEAQLNFDGTVKKVMIDPDADPTTETFSKWGSQSPDDPQVLR